MGPWPHALNTSQTFGDLDFGPESLIDMIDLQDKWFSRWLKVFRFFFFLSIELNLLVILRSLTVWPRENKTTSWTHRSAYLSWAITRYTFPVGEGINVLRASVRRCYERLF
jgi:hypothetical protein